MDTGALLLCIPEHVATQLKLPVLQEREASTADGKRHVCPYVGPVEVTFKNRSCFVGALVFGEEVLLSAVPIEDLDLAIFPATKTVDINPESPNLPMAPVMDVCRQPYFLSEEEIKDPLVPTSVISRQLKENLISTNCYTYVARHAWAGSFGDPQWSCDSLRELDTAGIDRYRQVVERLAERGFGPEIVATSPYTRCRQTAELIARHTPGQPEVVELDALEPGSDIGALLQWSRDTACRRICWVGHAPDVSHMTSALVGRGGLNIRFAKGAVAAIRLFSEIDYGAGELYWHATAKILGV